MVQPYRKNARSKNGQSNTLLETHINKANGKTKDALGGWCQRMNVPNWKTFVQNRKRWKGVAEKPKLCIKSCRAVLRRKRRLRRHIFINNLSSATCFAFINHLQTEHTIVVLTVYYNADSGLYEMPPYIITECYKRWNILESVFDSNICWLCNYTV